MIDVKEMGIKDKAQIAYEAYAKHRGWENLCGDSMLPWDYLRQDVKEAWHVVAEAVMEVYK